MHNLDNNFFQVFWDLSRRVQKIQKRIDEHEVSPKVRIALHKELERLQTSMENLRSQAEHVQQQALKQFEDIENQVISLYRVIEEKFEAYEITLISKQALELSKAFEKNAMINTAKRIHALRHNIHFLFKHRKPSFKNRKIITLVLRLSDQMEEALSPKGGTTKEHLQLIQMLRSLLREALYRAETFLLPEEGELAMELYEVADLYHHKKDKEALLKLGLIRSKLTFSQQKKLDQYQNSPEELVQILLEIANGDPCVTA